MAFPEEKEAWEQEKKKKGGYDMELINKDALKKDILALPNCYNGFSDTYDKACIIGVIDEQPTIEERKWIPCSERLPDTTDFVLTINIVSQCGVYRFDGDCWLDYDGLFVNEGIRAWMPLPEPI